MLQTIRDRATGVFAWIIVILITVPFAMWGIGEYFQTDSRLSAAEVDGEKIPLNQYQSIFQGQRNRLRQALGDKAAQNFDEALLKRLVVDQLVNETVLGNKASTAGLSVSDGQLLARVSSDPQFQLNGAFDPDLYARSLRSVGLSKAGYEHNLRRSMLIDQLQRGVNQSAMVTPQQLGQVVALDRQQRKVSLLRLDYADQIDQQEVSDSAVSDYYEAHRTEFRTPEQVIIEFIDLSADALVPSVTLEPGDLESWFDAHREQFQQPEGRQASHILLEVPAGADEAAVAAIRAKAEAIRKRALGGEDFAALAKEFSQDPASKDEGGRLGMVENGMMVDAFEKALFSIKSEGEISEPVKTEFGWHLIKLDKIRPVKGQTLDQVKDEATLAAKRQKAEDRYFDLGEALADRSYESPDNLEVAAEAVGLPVQTSKAFSRDEGTGIASNAAIRDAAFSDDVLNEGNNSAPIELGDHRVVVVRVAERIPASDQPLSTVKSTIVKRLQSEAAQAAAKETLDTLVEAISAGGTLADVAAGHGLKPEELGWIKRNQPLDPSIVNKAFSMPHPTDGKVTVDQLALADDALLAVVVSEVKAGSLEQLSDAERKLYMRQLAGAMARQEVDALTTTLKAESEIRIFEDNL